MIRVPTQRELDALDKELERYPERERDNHRFARFFSYADKNALYCREVPVYKRDSKGRALLDAKDRLQPTGTRRLPLRRRQWIEAYCRIRDKHGDIVPFILNAEQRTMECAMIRAERAGLPVRLVPLKPRQVGISTYIEAVVFEQAMRRSNVRALIVAHDDPTAAAVLSMADLMKDKLPNTVDERWKFDMRHDAKGKLVWREPISAELTVQSAKKKNPGIGVTLIVLHASETAKWEDAARKAKEMLQALPTKPGTFGFMESTAQGDQGYFHDLFSECWDERHVSLREKKSVWAALFFPWFLHEDYRYSKTYGVGREITKQQERALRETITAEEEWLLKTTYLRRWTPQSKWFRREGRWAREDVGHVRVSIDQLLWRRAKIQNDCNGDPLRPDTWNSFYEDYPALPEQAFLASGRPIFDASTINDRLRDVKEPLFRGEIVDESISASDFREADLGIDVSEKQMAVEIE
jgi:hypothetical protein